MRTDRGAEAQFAVRNGYGMVAPVEGGTAWLTFSSTRQEALDVTVVAVQAVPEPSIATHKNGEDPFCAPVAYACDRQPSEGPIRDSVALVNVGNAALCTGHFINNEGRRPILVTARHCYSENEEFRERRLALTAVEFQYLGECPADSFRPDRPTDFVSGGGVRLLAQVDDIYVLELLEAPVEGSNLYLSGYDAVDTPPEESFIVHHAGG